MQRTHHRVTTTARTPQTKARGLLRKQQQRKKRTLILSVICFIAAFSFFVYITHHLSFQIQKVIVNDLVYTKPADVEQTIDTQLHGQYIGLFSRSNSLTFPRQQIKQTLLRTYPAIASVSFELQDRHTIAVRITEHEPVALWCDSSVASAPSLVHDTEDVEGALPRVIVGPRNETCYVVHEQGIIFAPIAANVSYDGLIRLHGIVADTPIGKEYVQQKTLTDLLDFARLARRLEIDISDIWTTDGDVYALVTPAGTQLYIDAHDPTLSVFNNLQTVIERDAINKAQFNNIAYIDLRFGHRVFYKLK